MGLKADVFQKVVHIAIQLGYFMHWIHPYNVKYFRFIEFYTCMPNFFQFSVQYFCFVCFWVYLLEKVLVRTVADPILLLVIIE